MKRETKKFENSNIDYLYNEFEEWIIVNQKIKIEHMTSFHTGNHAYIIITYFNINRLNDI